MGQEVSIKFVDLRTEHFDTNDSLLTGKSAGVIEGYLQQSM